jgi:hypothetical protein
MLSQPPHYHVSTKRLPKTPTNLTDRPCVGHQPRRVFRNVEITQTNTTIRKRRTVIGSPFSGGEGRLELENVIKVMPPSSG